jgi:hypothetical protein
MVGFGFKVTGLKELTGALNGMSQSLKGDLIGRTITPIAQEAKARLEQDTPVVTGRLVRSTVLTKHSNVSYTLEQKAPYAGVVQARRNYWAGAIRVAQKWPAFVTKTVNDEFGVMFRRGGH